MFDLIAEDYYEDHYSAYDQCGASAQVYNYSQSASDYSDLDRLNEWAESNKKDRHVRNYWFYLNGYEAYGDAWYWEIAQREQAAIDRLLAQRNWLDARADHWEQRNGY